MTAKITEIIGKIEEQLLIVERIPTSFEPLQTPTGIDRDLLDEKTSEWKSGELSDSVESYLAYFKDIQETLVEYIALFKSEISGLKMLEYTTPKSVQEIMDKIGTKGVLNSEFGLSIIRGELVLRLQKEEWLVVNGEHLTVISDSEKQSYDTFKEMVK